MKRSTKNTLIIVTIFAIVNLLIFGLGFGVGILYPLTYTDIPQASKHLWYATSLQNYLWWTHLISFILTMVGAAVVNFLLVAEYKGVFKKRSIKTK